MSKQMITSSWGQALIEFALVIPILLLLVLGLFDLGSAVYSQNVISNAAREGARAGVVLDATDTTIRSHVQTTAPGLTNLQITIEPSVREASQPITVTISYSYTAITPFIGQLVGNGGKIPLSARSIMIVEGVNSY